VKLAVVPGDGVGPEVVAEALKTLQAAGVVVDPVPVELGGSMYLRTGEALPDSALSEIGACDAALLGAVGHPDVAPGILERGILLRLRFELDLYVNLRPVKLLPGVKSVLRSGDIDFVVVRENTEGPYAGAGGFLRKGTPLEVATQESLNTLYGAERCIRFAFEQAQRRARRHVTLVHKTNVLTYAGDLWTRAFGAVAASFPEISTAYAHIDAACLHCVTDPGRFDVVVTDNLFGDIITDLGAGIAGGIGLAASGNINPERETPSIFEPVHGSAPDIAGTGRANPLAAILSAAMLCDFLGEQEAAGRIEAAVAAVAGLPLTSTTDIGDRVVSALKGD
jgi:3-isopropylmalate dehydrogenase